ncbi:NAD(P)-binding domain-containing protein [uncultured Oscillibacter sp.]|uniref:NAD(P)-binding domain-containing protein n=1 Tax=uncultured Oscillibacter sp. TaxID=876091 RepID=UPI0026376F0F|nr:NAD(P)-binding domain-containing protein [uncultured Oscillibacter sp.]
MKIGFIGLGAMGRPMAKNLIRAGYELHVFDVVQAAVEELSAAGAAPEKSNREVAAASDVVITMLPNSPHVKAAICGVGGVLEGRHPGLRIIEMSSIAPLMTREVGAVCAEAGVPMLESPVSGGVMGAADGTLSLMCGGDPALLEELRPILEVLSSSIVLCGGLGAGNTTKLVNQHIIAVEIAAVAEAFAMGQKAGVEPEVIFNAIHNGYAGSKVLEGKLTAAMDRQFKAGFRLDLHIKDLANALETAHSVGAPMPLGSLVFDEMKYLSNIGLGGEDNAALMKYYERLADIEFHRGEAQ